MRKRLLASCFNFIPTTLTGQFLDSHDGPDGALRRGRGGVARVGAVPVLEERVAASVERDATHIDPERADNARDARTNTRDSPGPPRPRAPA